MSLNKEQLTKLAREYNPPLKEVYSKTADPKEERAAKKAISKMVSHPESSIYTLTPIVPELFAALLKARYSRTDLSAKQLLWREFVMTKQGINWRTVDKGIEILNQIFNFQKAEEKAERILTQFGDDSVFELGGGHLFMDRISMIASKIIEDTRIGLSPLEKSTRYVVFDQKGEDGDYSFYKDPKLILSDHKDLYLQTTRDCFDLYAKAVPRFIEHFKTQTPIQSLTFPDFSDNETLKSLSQITDLKSIKSAETAYRFSIRSKACDVARVLLPASAFTNIGEFGNARAYDYTFIKMKAMSLTEMNMIATEATQVMKQALPKFFDAVDNPYGKAYQRYLEDTEKLLKEEANNLLYGQVPEKVDRVELLTLDNNKQMNIAAALLYPYSNLPLKQILRLVRKQGPEYAHNLLKQSTKYRTNRRHKPPRAFEISGYELVYDILGNFGIFRDLHRQRMLTQQHQFYTTDHGFDMPEDFKAIGLDHEFESIMQQVKTAHDTVKKDFPEEAQYLTTMANYTRWYVGMNLREAFWYTELRSVPQGHFSYRTIAQDMYLQAKKIYPFLEDLTPMSQEYVNMSDRSRNLERMEAMQRIETKLARLDKNTET